MHPLEKFRYCPRCGSSDFTESSPQSKRCGNCGFEYFMNASAAYVALIVNENDELLVLTRGREPAKGTLDLPGGFSEIGETAEEGVRREVLEETGLTVDKAKYLFSQPNVYPYSGINIFTLDSFFFCEVHDLSSLKAADDAADCQWMAISSLPYELFGLRSIRHGVRRFAEEWKNRPTAEKWKDTL